MGTLRNFNLAPIIEQAGVVSLFETGTSSGDGVQYARHFIFDEIWSVEIVDEIAQRARQRFAGDSRVHILNATSEDALMRVLPAIAPSKPILFWLDAHFPGADDGLRGYKDEQDQDKRLPLARELDIIAGCRTQGRDVILIDDLRIYEDGPFEQGPLPDWAQTLAPEQRNLDFILTSRWAVTHDLRRIYTHTGYLMLVPKQADSVRLAA